MSSEVSRLLLEPLCAERSEHQCTPGMLWSSSATPSSRPLGTLRCKRTCSLGTNSLLKNLEIGALPVFLRWGLGRSDVVNRR